MGCWGANQGQPDLEAHALAAGQILGAGGAAITLGDQAHQVEPEAALAGRLGLSAKGGKKVGDSLPLRRQPGTLVLHREPRPTSAAVRGHPAQRYPDGSALAVVVQGVGEQVLDQLEQALGVAHHPQRPVAAPHVEDDAGVHDPVALHLGVDQGDEVEGAIGSWMKIDSRLEASLALSSRRWMTLSPRRARSK